MPTKTYEGTLPDGQTATMRQLSGDDARAFLERLGAEALAPHEALLRQHARRGRIAAVLHEPDGVEVVEAARVLGWKGAAPVWPLSAQARRALATSDPVTARWVRARPRPGWPKVLLLNGQGTLLLNGAPDGDWTIEPGSTDQLDPERVH